jgi:hypothetical protein
MPNLKGSSQGKKGARDYRLLGKQKLMAAFVFKFFKLVYGKITIF